MTVWKLLKCLSGSNLLCDKRDLLGKPRANFLEENDEKNVVMSNKNVFS